MLTDDGFVMMRILRSAMEGMKSLGEVYTQETKLEGLIPPLGSRVLRDVLY